MAFCPVLISQNGNDGLPRTVVEEEREKNVVLIMESVLGGSEPRGEIWEHVSELVDGLAGRLGCTPWSSGTGICQGMMGGVRGPTQLGSLCAVLSLLSLHQQSVPLGTTGIWKNVFPSFPKSYISRRFSLFAEQCLCQTYVNFRSILEF